ncbi:MAG: UDP-N-acetylglucosamine 2-epimerase (non-hydrolyzing) [Chloroflexi bacterium]|nr:UDP-N-acetylglucosamine 2-epimerase (non-hydrolyzing) [Chloroflexota bacterium]MBV9595549.1 UDP-N-acetylglucosamine 2-epimerase (non-hydrolyzing) [Chloroflexota bacterium]
MPRLKVLTVFGTRPEAVKLGPVIRELARHPQRIDTRVCVTAQHRDMLDQVLSIFGIHPEYDLDVMQDNQTPTQVASVVLARLEPVLQVERPDWVLVQGDTTTVAVAALAAFYQRARVGHVEAGLRTGDRWQPFPEEINRRIAGVIADRHFAPTERSRQNLLREDVPAERILVTGNPGIDALRWITTQPEPPVVRDLLLEAPEARTILVTAHRRENFGEPIRDICQALRELVERYAGSVRIIYPVHRNPNVWGPVHELLGTIPHVTLTPPLDYLSNLQLMKRAYLVVTDSGGIQEEAAGLGIPGLVLREVTERPEGVETGALRVVGTDRERIVSETCRLLDDPHEYARMAQAENPFGDGHAAGRIVASLLNDP